jgi:large subunit ribosomal protein L18
VLKTIAARQKRHFVVRKRISGTKERPRLCVFRSARHIYAQLIDDVAGVTCVSASTQEKDFSGFGGNKKAAHSVGLVIAAKARAAGISKVVFDRGGYKYHGRVQELADGARAGGLVF